MSLHEDGNRVKKGEHDEVQNDIPRGVIFVKKWILENLKFEMGDPDAADGSVSRS